MREDLNLARARRATALRLSWFLTLPLSLSLAFARDAGPLGYLLVIPFVAALLLQLWFLGASEKQASTSSEKLETAETELARLQEPAAL